MSVLEQIKKDQRLFLIGYGSGAGALTLSAKAVGQHFQSDLNQQIKNGKELTVDQYRDWKSNLVAKLRNDY